MKQIILPVTVHLNIRLPLALLQPEPADAPTGPEPEAHACQGCGGCGNASMKKSKSEPIPVMDYRQYRRARRLVHECCNYDGGHCIALDWGGMCLCPVHFLLPVVPVVPGGGAAAGQRTGNGPVPPLDAKRCAVCGALFTPGSNRAKYCPECAGHGVSRPSASAKEG